jgi:uncharacterized phage protein (TIGR02218 family)
MKTCSDSLKALLHQYRTGEKRTWYIADLYTVWLKNVEKTTIGWSGDKLQYVNARFDKGVYQPLGIYQTNGKIKIPCPSSDVINWNNDDWTIEFFVQTPWDDWDYFEDEHHWYGDLLCFAIAESPLPTTRIEEKGLFISFWNGRSWSDTYDDIQAHFSVSLDKEYENYITVWPQQTGDYPYEWNHVAIYKKGNVLYGALNGVVRASYELLDDDRIYIPPNSYIHILATMPNININTTGIIDEVRISTCCRYPDTYKATYTVPTEPFTPDEYTLSLLHLDGNLDDEGFMVSPMPPTTKDFGGGEILLYTGHDTDLTCGDNKYRHIAIEHGDIEESRGTETATMDLTINYNPSDTITPNDERTWFRALKDGVFDKAYVSLDRLYSPIPWQYNMPNIPIDYVLKSRFFGRMDVQEVKLDHASIQVKSPTDMLTRELPRNLVKPSCLNHFGDFMCQYDPETFRKTVTAQAGSNQSKIVIGQTFTQGDYNNGLICCTGGKNKGQFSTIRTYANGEVILFKPFVEEVQVGDTFDMLCGCDKTLKMCRDVYKNLEHFRGCPFLPCKNVLI